jgi:hypothetical protein
MEYAALFAWLTLCMLLSAVMHHVMAGSMRHRMMQLLAAPGMVVRKLSMTVVALVCGATVTRVRVYEVSSRDIDFQADGASSVAKALAPLGPFFAAAAVAAVLNAAFGRPLTLDYTPPALSSLDAGGVGGFLSGTWALLSGAVRQTVSADWHSARLYVLFALLFSLALGASVEFGRLREAVLGAALLSLAMALLSTIAVRRAAGMAAAPGGLSAARGVVLRNAGIAVALVLYGLLASVVVGVAVRLYELVASVGPQSGGRQRSSAADGTSSRRAA